jgi:hypothetical protein
MPVLILVGPPGSGVSTLAFDLSQEERVIGSFSATIDAQTVDQALAIASHDKSTIILVIDISKFFPDQPIGYRNQCYEIARKLRDANLKFLIVGTATDKLREKESGEIKKELQEYFPETVYAYSAARSLLAPETPQRVPPVFSSILPRLEKGMEMEDDAKRVKQASLIKSDQQEKSGLLKAADSKETVNEPTFSVKAPGGWEISATGRITYPLVLPISFLLIFLVVSQLAANIKGTDTQIYLNSAITVIAVVAGFVLLYWIYRVVRNVLPAVQAPHARTEPKKGQ